MQTKRKNSLSSLLFAELNGYYLKLRYCFSFPMVNTIVHFSCVQRDQNSQRMFDFYADLKRWKLWNICYRTFNGLGLFKPEAWLRKAFCLKFSSTTRRLNSWRLETRQLYGRFEKLNAWKKTWFWGRHVTQSQRSCFEIKYFTNKPSKLA